MSPLPSTGPTPIWLVIYFLICILIHKNTIQMNSLKSSINKVNTKFLSPLIAAYDERLIEKDQKLQLLKVKISHIYLIKYPHLIFI